MQVMLKNHYMNLWDDRCTTYTRLNLVPQFFIIAWYKMPISILSYGKCLKINELFFNEIQAFNFLRDLIATLYLRYEYYINFNIK